MDASAKDLMTGNVETPFKTIYYKCFTNLNISVNFVHRAEETY